MRVRFAAFEVDLATGEVLRSGSARGRLQEQPLAVLAALVEDPGRLVSRDELRHRLWPDDVHVGYDSGLNKAVLKLRTTLGDSAESPRFIETVPRRGYRFLASVTRTPADQARDGEKAATPAVPTASRRTSSRWKSAALLAAAAVVGAAWITSSPRGRASSLPASALAILPFQHLGPGEEGPAFGLGLADTLITRLSSVSGLTVRPTSSVSRYADHPVAALEAGRELQVDRVLEGSVQRQEGRVRVSVRLLSVEDGRPLWAEVLEEPSRDLFELQDRLSERVVAGLSLRLTREETRRLSRRQTDSVDAYEQYMTGFYFLDRSSPENLPRSIAAFRRAVELDPDYALAHAGIALAHAPILFWGMADPEEVTPPLEAAAARAAELDDSLAEVQLALGQVASLHWDWESEERAYQRAIALNPNLPKSYAWYGFLLNMLGRSDESLAMVRRAFELDPTGPVTKVNLAITLMRGGRYEEALAQIESTLELEPDYYWALILRGELHLARGEPQKAIRLFEKSGAWTLHILALARSGDPAAGRRILEERVADAAAAGEYVSEFQLAKAHCALGDVDRALELLEVAYRKRLWELSLLTGASELTALRGDPRFRDIVRRVGLPSRGTSQADQSPSTRETG